MDMEAIISGAISGGLFGALATIYAPRVQRAMRAQDELDKHRRQLIREWRDRLGPVRTKDPGKIPSLRPHMTERESTVLDALSTHDAVVQHLHTVIDRLEREWFPKDFK